MTYLWLSKHIDKPTADGTIRAARDEIMRILRADHLHGIDRVCMPCSR